MATLMGKNGMKDWIELDHTDSSSDYTEQEQKDYLEKEYRLTLGRSWAFKWID